MRWEKCFSEGQRERLHSTKARHHQPQNKQSPEGGLDTSTIHRLSL